MEVLVMNIDLHSIEKKSAILVILVLIILSLVIYWPVQDYDFLNYDDPFYVTDIYSQKDTITFKDISDAFTGFYAGNWHPLTMMSHMLDWQLFRDKAGGHHWTSVIIHIFNTILLFLLFRKMTGSLWRSAFVAALFAVHPINVESVAWIAERKNVLSTFFWILTMLLYVWYVKQPSWKRYLPVFLCFALGLMSKPMLVTLPFVLLLIDYWPLNRTTSNIQNEYRSEIPALLKVSKAKLSFLFLEKIPLFILTAISIYMTLYTQQSVKAIVNLDTLPLVTRISNAIVSYGLYIKKMFWPVDLAVIYPWVTTPSWQIIVMVTLLVIITIIVCKYFLRYPYLAIGWFWYVGTLIPVIGIVQVGNQSMADRYAYIPFIGLFVMIVWGMGDVFKKIFSTKVVVIISGMTLVALIIVSYHQVQYWQNTFTLFNHVVNVTENNSIAHNNLACELIKQNKVTEAMHHYQIALSINPTNYYAMVGIASVYYQLGEKNKAMDTLRLAIKVNPECARAYNDLYGFLLQTGKVEEAMKEYRKAVELSLNKNNFELHYSFGNALATQGHYNEAVIQYNQVLRIQPRNAFVHYNLATVLFWQRKVEEALKHFREAVELQPRYANAHYRLALILRQKGLTEEANRHYQEAVRINPAFKDGK
jgi:tetratricopeptide (TPR) repeat protein